MTVDEKNLMLRQELVNTLLERWQPIPIQEEVPLEQACGRVCAVDIYSKNTLPVGRASRADGIGVRFADFSAGIPDVTAWQKGRDYVAADTGDDFDDAFDTVIPVEDLRFHATTGALLSIEPEEPIQQGQRIRPRGGLLQEGELLLRRGATIRPIDLCLLATGGITLVPVWRQPYVLYLPTGNELVPPGRLPQRGENIESNGIMIEYLLRHWGARCSRHAILPDQPAALAKALDEAIEKADIILLNGGSSKGSEDYSVRLLAERSSFLQHGVRCIPGIPVAAALISGKPVINLPGPPFAAFSAMDWCVQPLLAAFYGRLPSVRPSIKVQLSQEVKKPAEFEFYLRLELTETGEGISARPLGMATPFAESIAHFNAVWIAPIGRSLWQAGEWIEATLL